jgi:hypothetical protein
MLVSRLNEWKLIFMHVLSEARVRPLTPVAVWSPTR